MVCDHPSKRQGEDPLESAARFLDFFRTPPSCPPSSVVSKRPASETSSPSSEAASKRSFTGRDVAGELASSGILPSAAAEAIAELHFARIFNQIYAAMSLAQLRALASCGATTPLPPPLAHPHPTGSLWALGGGGGGPLPPPYQPPPYQPPLWADHGGLFGTDRPPSVLDAKLSLT